MAKQPRITTEQVYNPKDVAVINGLVAKATARITGGAR